VFYWYLLEILCYGYCIVTVSNVCYMFVVNVGFGFYTDVMAFDLYWALAVLFLFVVMMCNLKDDKLDRLVLYL